MLAPVLRSSDSQASIMTVANGLPPVKDNGHRSVGSRSVGGAVSAGGRQGTGTVGPSPSRTHGVFGLP